MAKRYAPSSASFEERFWAKADTSDPLGCWLWLASKDPRSGYARCQSIDLTSTTTAHRVSYELAMGDIPYGYEIDHLCRNRACVNPLHLEAVTHRENIRRQPKNQVTHCPQGHPYDAENTYQPKGKRTNRMCRTCRADQGRAA